LCQRNSAAQAIDEVCDEVRRRLDASVPNSERTDGGPT
jgi:hypothetical protein